MTSLFRKYVLDTNVLISASQLHFKFASGTRFWEFMLEAHNAGEFIVSIDKVLAEIAMKKDDLHEWSQNAPKSFFARSSLPAVDQALFEIVGRLQRMGQYSDDAHDDFLAAADSRIIAYAKIESATVVTQEKRRDNAIERVYIPSVCAQEGIPCIDMFKMLEELKFPTR